MKYTDEVLGKLSVYELTVLVNAAARQVVAKAKEMLDSQTDEMGKRTAYALYYLTLEPAEKISRRVDYTKDKDLPNTGHLRYEARAILMEGVEWQSKVGPMIDFYQEIDRLMEKAGLNTWPAEKKESSA